MSYIIVRAFRHLIACKGLGSLIIPQWPSYFWPFVNPTNGAVRHFIKEYFVLPRCFPVFDTGRGHAFYFHGRDVVFSKNPASLRVLALRLDCT